MILLFAFPLFLYFIPHMYELYITKTCDSYISFDNINLWGAESAYAIKGNTLKKVSLEYFVVNEKESDISYYKYAMGEVTDAELEAYENSLPYKICDYDATTCEVKGNKIVDDDGNIINNPLIVHAKEKSSSREFVLYEIPDCDITIVKTYNEMYYGATGYVYKADKYIGKINLTFYDGIDSVYLRKK